MTVCSTIGTDKNLNADSKSTGSAFILNPSHDYTPPLPPRLSPNPSTHGSPRLSQGWHSPAPSAPTPSQLASAPYMSTSYALTQSSSDAPVNPTWDSSPPDMSTGAVNYRSKQHLVHHPGTKPPLPVSVQYMHGQNPCLDVPKIDGRFLIAKTSSRFRSAQLVCIKNSVLPRINNDD